MLQEGEETDPKHQGLLDNLGRVVSNSPPALRVESSHMPTNAFQG